MSDITKGVLIYNEWFEAMRSLNQKDYKTLINAIYNAQIHDLPPPEFTGRAGIVASMIFPCIERRKKQSGFGRAGAEARLARLRETGDSEPTYPSDYPSNYPSSHPSDYPSSHPLNQSRVKKNKIEYSRVESSKDDGSVAEGRRADAVGRAPADAREALALSKKERDVNFETDRGYGVFKNVYLSQEEYLKIKNAIPNADDYIDLFSQKIYDRGYRYPSHAKAILDWYEKDKKLPSHRRPAEPPQGREGSFDTDEFFAAAVRRSLGSDK